MDRRDSSKLNGPSRNSEVPPALDKANLFPMTKMISPKKSVIACRRSRRRIRSGGLIFTPSRSQKKFPSGTENRKRNLNYVSGKRKGKIKSICVGRITLNRKNNTSH